MDDEEMGESFQVVSFGFEIDLDYEFDAARYFDFGRPETQSEAREAELWFATAGSYPPYPLIVKIYSGKDIKLENLRNVSDLDVAGYDYSTSAYDNDCAGPETSQPYTKNEGWMSRISMPEDVSAIDSKSTTNGPFFKGSTLMKPTVSQLAKQIRRDELKSASRNRKPLTVKSGMLSEDSTDYPLQAAKRQRLEKGHLCKVATVSQHSDLIHKVREKNIGHGNCHNGLPRLKLTIPREPELETMRRAERLRTRRLRSSIAKQLQEEKKPTTYTFRARPLNRKILEPPVLPLPKKSNPRVMNFKCRTIQHSAGLAAKAENHYTPATQGAVAGNNRRPENRAFGSSQLQNDAKKLEEYRKGPPKFKARPLDKKILSSKGEVGVFRSTKRELTVPKEFKFSTSKRCQQTPLTELLNELSLSSQPVTAQKNIPPPNHVATKVSFSQFLSFNEKFNLNIHLHTAFLNCSQVFILLLQRMPKRI
ncbi:protein TPX2-like isoform X3 [Typha latifolia]|uniref:protein TPX2-like isoform X3 n=1 Tax=Typha latifolia TaxID=4733 RepID=UPI003C2D1C35